MELPEQPWASESPPPSLGPCYLTGLKITQAGEETEMPSERCPSRMIFPTVVEPLLFPHPYIQPRGLKVSAIPFKLLAYQAARDLSGEHKLSV